MAFSERLPGTIKPSYNDTWRTNAETEALTRALQTALFSNNNNNNNCLETIRVSNSGSGSGHDPVPDSRVVATVSSGRILKRSRTTFIKANPRDFMEMVQKVTGFGSGSGGGGVVGASQVVARRNVVLKPKARRIRVEPVVEPSVLPTLDTSSHFLGLENSVYPSPGPSPKPVGNGAGFSDEEESFDFSYLLESFPTMESWGEM